jgi:hypothetical protein
MKMVIKTAMCAVMLLSTVNANADDKKATKAKTFESTLYITSEGKLRVNVDNKGRSSMLIVIRTMDGETVNKYFISKKKMKSAVNYDLSDLEVGEYKIQVTNGNHVDVNTFRISSEQVMPIRRISIK